MRNRLLKIFILIIVLSASCEAIAQVVETPHFVVGAKNTETLVHSRHRSINNFSMNLVSALWAYCFYDNKPRALSGFEVARTTQLALL